MIPSVEYRASFSAIRRTDAASACGIGVETGETERRRAAIGRRDVACVEIMELGNPAARGKCRRRSCVGRHHLVDGDRTATRLGALARPFST